jgi:alpha-beta hydrolase superfamily lysophospholipase
MQDVFYPSGDGKTTIHACVWQPVGEVKGIVQIVHGMAEYAERYALFARYLTDSGYLVCAEDHLGHGKSVTSKDNLGYFCEGKAWQVVLGDIRALSTLIKEKYPRLPYFIIGHSMGSFFVRKYISLYGSELSGAVIMGTGFQASIVTSTAKAITALVALFKGWNYRSKFVNNLAFGSYNKKIENVRTEYDWLSQNADNVDKYIADELCGVPFTCDGFYGLFSIVNEACKSKTIKAVPKKLPLYLVAGSDDPVGAYSEGVIKLYSKYEKNGNDVQMTIYNGCRHEIINDDCAPQTMSDILEFLDKAMPLNN